MNILLIHHYAVPPDLPGISRHYDLMEQLARLGHRPVIVASANNHRNSGHIAIPPGASNWFDQSRAVPFLWLKGSTSRPGHIARIWAMLSFAWRVLRRTGFDKINGKRPDVVIGCSPDPFTAYAAYRVARYYGVPYVLHVGDIWPRTLIDVGGASPWNPFVLLLGMLEKRLYKAADLIISPLPFAHHHIAEFGVPADRVVCVPTGLNTQDLPPLSRPDAVGKMRIYYAGALSPANSLDVMLDAVENIKKRDLAEGFEFHFLGAGPKRTGILQRVAQGGLDNVYVHDPVPKAEVFGALAQADAFMLGVRDLPLYQCGISLNKLVDFMAMGRPIVMSSSAANDPVSEAGAGFTVPANNPAAMADAFVRLAALTGEERWKMGRNGRDYMIKHHDIAQLGRLLAECLEKHCVARS